MDNIKKYNQYKTRLYTIWRKMKERCNNIHHIYYKYYGSRDVKVCDEWSNSFIMFKNWALNNGYNDNLTIDRIDNNLGYFPENCRWSTYKEQANNRINNIVIEYNGKIKTLQEWSDITGIHRSTINRRVINKKELFTKPTHQPKYYTFNEETHTLLEWSKILNVNKKFLEGRILKGWPIEKVFSYSKKSEINVIIYKGEALHINEWAKRLNCNRKTIWNRINRLNWSIEKALTTPTK